MNYLPEGTEICCPKCATVISKLTEDYYFDQEVTSMQIEPISFDYEDIEKNQSKCPACREPYIVFNGRGHIHTKAGWK